MSALRHGAGFGNVHDDHHQLLQLQHLAAGLAPPGEIPRADRVLQGEPRVAAGGGAAADPAAGPVAERGEPSQQPRHCAGGEHGVGIRTDQAGVHT